MRTRSLSAIHTRLQRVASRVPQAEGLTEEAIRRMSDQELADAIGASIEGSEPDDPLREQLESALASMTNGHVRFMLD